MRHLLVELLLLDTGDLATFDGSDALMLISNRESYANISAVESQDTFS